MSRPRPLRIGLAQLPVAMGDKPGNLRSIRAYLDRAARRKFDVVVFPECSLAGWLSTGARAAAEPIPGPLTEELGRRAREFRMAIVMGLEERHGRRIHNSAVLIDREGRLRLHHRKIDELEIGRRLYTTGQTLAVGEFEGRTVALDICADSWRPTVTDALFQMGARLIFSPCAWAVEPGGEATNLAWISETYRLRCQGRDLTIAAANGVGRVTQGPWRGRVLQGNSLVTGPGGMPILRGPASRPALLAATVP
ncbi:MAG TPA: carbon-nitrogen hydrolase family protein [Planctomycetota bacterium]|nr:carbon-nitrogen hydrolase family protein [Planctomycetota bacterium]